MLNSSPSAMSFCGGRNDLTQYFTPANTSASQTRAANDDSLQTFDVNKLAASLLGYNQSDMCQQYYSTGSGSIMQWVMVNRSCRCALFDQTLYSNGVLKRFSTLLRPLLYGKIYYHPSNKHYDALIKEMNRTFESLEELVRLFRQAETPLQSIQDMLQSLCQSSFQDQLSSLCPQLPTYQTSISMFVVLTEFVACSECNRFVAMNSEADMVREGQNKSVTNNFLAAIKFVNDISDGEGLPKHVQYKIRMNLDYVDSTFRTEDR